MSLYFVANPYTFSIIVLQIIVMSNQQQHSTLNNINCKPYKDLNKL